MLFRPNVTPDSTKYIKWADTISFSNKDTLLAGPFDFEKISAANRTRQKVARIHWKLLKEQCIDRGILPPTLGSPRHFKMQPITTRSKRGAKRQRS